MFYVLIYWIHLQLIGFSLLEATCAQGSNILPQEGNYSPSSQSITQHVFVAEEFHHLNVSRVETVEVWDIFDCTFECIRNPLCSSVNLAASKGGDGKLWCELLSSDKYRDPPAYKGNISAHHYHIESPCSSTPCQNGGICLTNYKTNTYECFCERGFMGDYCEKAPKSCKDLYDLNKLNVSQLVTLLVDFKLISLLCHMGNFGCGDGGWTPVMKIDGNKGTFHYNSEYWSNKNEYNLPGGETGFDFQETKLPTYWGTSFSKICLGMKVGQQTNFIVINKQANSLHSLIADGQYRGTPLGRTAWKTLIGSQASLQLNCNKEGFNAAHGGDANSAKARIGILGNEQNNCDSCDSRIGFGTGGRPDDTSTCGNGAYADGDNGNKLIKAMGYVLVQ